MTDYPDGYYAVPVEAGDYNGRFVQILSGVERDATVFLRYMNVRPSGGNTTSEVGGEEGQGQMSGYPGMSGNFPSMGGYPSMGGQMSGRFPGMGGQMGGSSGNRPSMGGQMGQMGGMAGGQMPRG